MDSSAHTFMQLAIDAAQRVYSTAPNPRVGCVIVRDGHIVGTGLHEKPGEHHAEVNALIAAGELAEGLGPRTRLRGVHLMRGTHIMQLGGSGLC